jgi:cytochrome c oxidase assembly factor CtaG
MFLMRIVGQTAYLLPWMIVPAGGNQGLAVEAMLGQPLSTTIPILATILWIVVFVAVAIWHYQHEEF